MVGDDALLEFEQFDEVTDAAVLRGEQLHDSETRRIGEYRQKRGE